MADLADDQTHEVDYTYSSQSKDPAAPNFSVTISIDDMKCHIPSDRREAIPVTVVPGGSHMLGKEYVGALLDKWFEK